MKFKDLTGLEFNNFKVLYRLDDYVQQNGRHRSQWMCLCRCGKEFDVFGDNINNKQRVSVMSCPECANINRSIHNRVDVIGNKYNRLQILESVYDEGKTMAICICDCGNIYKASQADVVCGHTKSCGCLQRERASEANTKDWTGVVSDYGVEFLCQDYMREAGQWIWKCRCGLCGNIFSVLPANVMENKITSCGCTIQSAGERYIQAVLEELGVDYISQYIIKDCKYINPLRFDFAVFDNTKLLYMIEYDGQQHFKPIEYFGGTTQFHKSQIRDEIKNEYCALNNIKLLRLPYTLSEQDIKHIIYEHHLSVTTAGCT